MNEKIQFVRGIVIEVSIHVSCDLESPGEPISKRNKNDYFYG